MVFIKVTASKVLALYCVYIMYCIIFDSCYKADKHIVCFMVFIETKYTYIYRKIKNTTMRKSKPYRKQHIIVVV